MARGPDVFIARFARTWPTRRVFPSRIQRGGTGLTAIILYKSVYAIRIARCSTMCPPTHGYRCLSVCLSVWTCLINAYVFVLSFKCFFFFFILSPPPLQYRHVRTCTARARFERFQGYRQDKKNRHSVPRGP